MNTMKKAFETYDFSPDSVKKRAEALVKQVWETEERKTALKTILASIDLTTLSGDDTREHVSELCATAMSLSADEPSVGPVAAVCVYPIFAKLVSDQLRNSQVKTACVAGAFPSGQSPLNIRIAEVADAVEQGADEIDMVISRGKLLEGDEDYISQEVSEIKKACGKAHLKVILETGELGYLELVQRASILAIEAGADFIKTSTGKIQPAATTEAFLVMLDVIKAYYESTNKMIGIKPAGGIAEPEEALVYYALVKAVLGDAWLNKTYFRIGASRLAGKVYNELV